MRSSASLQKTPTTAPTNYEVVAISNKQTSSKQQAIMQTKQL